MGSQGNVKSNDTSPERLFLYGKISLALLIPLVTLAFLQTKKDLRRHVVKHTGSVDVSTGDTHNRIMGLWW